MKVKSMVYKILSVCILVTAFTLPTACSGNTQLSIDDPVPNFKLEDINGKTYTLSDYRGKPVLIHYWDTTFDACTKEIPYLQALYDEWTQSGAGVLLTVDALPQDTASVIKTFMETNKYTFPVLLDTDAKVAGKYNVQLVPTSILVSKDGKLKLNVAGPFKDKAALDKQLAAYLN